MPSPAPLAPHGTTPPPGPGALLPTAHLREMAAILAEISGQIETLGEALCSDPSFAARHIHELQAIDLIAQKQRALAQMLCADCARSALTTVGLEEIVSRFRTLGGASA